MVVKYNVQARALLIVCLALCNTMCDITATLWFLVLVGTAAADLFYFNDEIDGFFSQFRQDIRDANNTKFPLPNMNVMYTKSLLFMSVHGEMNGTDGTIRDLSTIKRTSNATIVTSKEYFVFKAQFGFDNLKIAYDYVARFMGIPFKGDFELAVDNNSIYIELLVNLTSNRCSGNVVTIRNLRFTRLDQISIKVTGFSMLNRLVNYFLSRSLHDVSTKIIIPIEEGLRAFFRENISQFDFCKFGTVPENVPFDDMDSSDDIPSNVEYNINNKSKEINAVLN